MDRNTMEQLSGVFVQNMPKTQQFLRDGSLNPDWLPWMNAFDTWMQQANTPIMIADGLYAVRTGSVITVTGTVKAGAMVDTIGPAVTFTHDGVEFNKDGFIKGGTDDTSLSVQYIARR